MSEVSPAAIRHHILNSLECPICGKELSPLEPYDEDGKYNYWCDTCDVDICIKDNKEPQVVLDSKAFASLIKNITEKENEK